MQEKISYLQPMLVLAQLGEERRNERESLLKGLESINWRDIYSPGQS